MRIQPHFILDLGERKAARHQRQNSCPTRAIPLPRQQIPSSSSLPSLQSYLSSSNDLSLQNVRYV